MTLAAAAFNLIFIPVALMAHPHWGAIGHAFFTWKPLPGFNRDTVLIILSDIGATVTPWMLFFQQSATVDKGLTTKDIHFGRIDTVLGAGLAAAAALGAIVATAPLFGRISAENFEAAQFAQALVPVIGRFGASAVCAGHGGSGHRGGDYDFDVVGLCVWRSGAAAAQFESAGERRASRFMRCWVCARRRRRGSLLIPGLPLVFVVLVVNVVAVLAMPPALVFLYLLVNDKEIMGGVPSPGWANFLAGAVVVLLTAAGILYGISVVAPNALAWIGRL